MMLRPAAAQWFELVTDRRHVAEVMQLLAHSHVVELEIVGKPVHAVPYKALADQLADVGELMKRYGAYWPQPAVVQRSETVSPIDWAEQAISRLYAWEAAAEPLVDALEAEMSEQIALTGLQEALTAGRQVLPDLTPLAKAGPLLQARLYRGDERLARLALPVAALQQRFSSKSREFLLLLARVPDLDALAAPLHDAGAQQVPLPQWIAAKPDEALAQVNKRLEELGEAVTARRAGIAALNKRLQVADALGTLRLVEWLGEHASDLQETPSLAWITGWVSDTEGSRVRAALDAAGIHYLFRTRTPPVGVETPLFLDNSSWGRRFEPFTRLLGIPAADSVDPSSLMAFIVPLLFGYMFGDVGQGALILLVGLVFGRRIEALRFLVPSGVAAMGFGVLFGSLFGLEHVIPALWFRPMEEPVRALVYGLAAGVAILTLGLLLAALQAHWRRKGLAWWGRDAGMLVCYGGLLASPFAQSGLLVAALGALWFIIGGLAGAGRNKQAGEGPGSVFMVFAETLFQLLVNTVSFARVGAFALAHAGLSAAVVGIAEAAGDIGWWLAIVLGNVLIVALEGLVVSIQTTRLMLFEFFVRFFDAGGRPFRPLAPPVSAHQAESGQAMESSRP